MIDQLRQLIDDLTHDREVLDERLRLATELLATFNDVEPEAKPTKPTKTPKGWGEQISCPDCGQRMKRGGLGPHRARRHPDSAAKPVELRSVPATFDADAARERAAAAI